MNNIKESWVLFREAVFHSYSMVFFSLDRWFAGLLLLLSFLDPVAGFSGLFSVLTVNGLAVFLGFNRQMIRRGELGFNALLVGLGLGAVYELNFQLVVLLFFAALITLFITMAVLGIMTKYELPFLSLPFVFALWAVMLASRNFEALGVSQRGLYLLNELYAVGDSYLVDFYDYLNRLNIPFSVKTYLRSLSAILFQYNIVAGSILALALLFYSRIAFTLSLLGFFTAYGFYDLIGADLNQLNYSYIGFNFILSAIAVGGIFLVASGWSYLWVLLLVPMLTIISGSLANLLAIFQLPVYALPFNFVVLSFIYLLKWRARQTAPELVALQTFSPEKNRYNYLSGKLRFHNYRNIAIGLPIMGEWSVSQGHEGNITHREEWKHAWDFIILDEQGRPFRNGGEKREDYYCYGKPVVAPADGTVVEIRDMIEENQIGETNLEQNWGNSILIDHGYSLYSQLSHLQPGSFQVKKGDYVKKGRQLALCGSSGRSPEPHLHFQLQTTPYIGAPTLLYPIAFYLSRNEEEGVAFRFFDFPAEGCLIQNLQPLDLLKYAFYFAPGKRLRFAVEGRDTEEWECRADMYNNTYIECLKSGDKAYFHNNGYLHYFTGYEGRRHSPLFFFFLAHYKVALGFQENMQIEDHFPLHLLEHPLRRSLQDFLTPFVQFKKAGFELEYGQMEGDPFPEEVRLESKVTSYFFGRAKVRYRFRTTIRHSRIDEFEVEYDGKKIGMKWVDEGWNISRQSISPSVVS
jgi:urea transporter/murein DD-endopeptidase MepM/ murein hydrolase activator NlpD